MKIISVQDVKNTERHVNCPNGGFESLRLILEKDGRGFSLHKTIIPGGDTQHWHYKNHLEACFCISGFGVLKNLKTNETFEIKKDVCYVLDKNDDHEFTAHISVVLISVFNPPVKGQEVHQEDGSYE